MKRIASELELGPDVMSEQITATRSYSLGEVQELKVGGYNYDIATLWTLW